MAFAFLAAGIVLAAITKCTGFARVIPQLAIKPAAESGSTVAAVLVLTTLRAGATAGLFAAFGTVIRLAALGIVAALAERAVLANPESQVVIPVAIDAGTGIPTMLVDATRRADHALAEHTGVKAVAALAVGVRGTLQSVVLVDNYRKTRMIQCREVSLVLVDSWILNWKWPFTSEDLLMKLDSVSTWHLPTRESLVSV